MIAGPSMGLHGRELYFGAETRSKRALLTATAEGSKQYAGITKPTSTFRANHFQSSPPTKHWQNASPPSVVITNAAAPRLFTPFQKPKPIKFCFPPAKDTFDYKSRGLVGSKQETTKVKSLIGGAQLFQKLDETLDKAKSWVMIDLYNMQSPALYPERHSPHDTPGADLQTGLVQKLVDLQQKKNVKVRVILDNSKMMVQPPFTLEPEHNTRTLEFLRANGIETVTYPREVSRISHPKVLMVDNKYAVVSGMNWGNHSPTNHDGGVYIKGPDVRNIFHKVFKPDWITSGGDEDKLPKVSPFSRGKIQVLQTSGEKSHQGAKDEILQTILSQVEKAQKSIHAELFVLTNKRVVDSLIDKHHQLKAAGQEGVKVLVDPGLYFKFPNCRPGIQKMARAGVPIRFLECDRDREEKLHAKWAVFDRKTLLTGSANWSGVGLESKGVTYEYFPVVDEDAMDVDAGHGAEAELRPVLKGNHEVNLLIENAPNVAETFAKQASYDFKHASFPILEKGSDNKWHPIKPTGAK